MKRIKNDFSNSETQRKKKRFQKNSKTPRKKKLFKFCKTIFLFSKYNTIFTHFPAVFSMKMKKFRFHQILFSKSNRFQSSKRFLFVFQPFSAWKQKYFRFQNLIVFKCFKTIFSVFQPFSVWKRKHFRLHQNFVFKI